MVDVKETYQSGKRMIIVHINSSEEPAVYSPEEAQEIKEQLEDLGF